MPKFSERSQRELATCQPALQLVFNRVIKTFDCTIIEGFRGEERQNEYFRTNRSQISWPDGKHNKTPSWAVDVAPCPIDWEDVRRFYLFAGFVIATGLDLKIPLRWGGDWDGDFLWRDQKFHDLPHFELERVDGTW